MLDRLRQIILTSGTNLLENSMEIETSLVTRPWAWYAGAYQQYQTAFLLLVEVFAYPMRKEADRIWHVLDYVFEVPPGLERERKARLIITEIRDRLGIYRDARKLRAPLGMLQHLGVQAPRKVMDKAVEAKKSEFSPLAQPSHEFSNPRTAPAAYGLMAADYVNQTGGSETGNSDSMIFTPPSGPPSLTGGSDGTSVTSPSTGGPSTAPNAGDDLMADIDWVSVQ